MSAKKRKAGILIHYLGDQKSEGFHKKSTVGTQKANYSKTSGKKQTKPGMET